MSHWAQIEERGIVWGMRFLLRVYLLFGRRFLQLFLYPVVSYYWLVNSPGRSASLRYFQQLAQFDSQIKPSLWLTYRHFIIFANAIIDKLAAWSGSLTLDDVDYSGRTALMEYLDRGHGVLVLGSHLGNLEVCRVIAKLRQNVRINVLVHTLHTEKFNALLNEYADSSTLSLIQVTQINASTAMRLQDKIAAGELVIIAADRVPVSANGRIHRVDFLGRQASFPQGPFILASLLKCPVFTLFCLKHQNRPKIYFEHFSDSLAASKNQRQALIEKSIERFAQILQRYCLQAPMQWFNFYDFWKTPHE